MRAMIPRLDATTREEIGEYFEHSYTLFASLFDLLITDEVFYRHSEPTRHPMIFYYGHTAVFYINKLLLAGAITQRINPHFESLFAVGVDEMHWDEGSERFAWPPVEAVRLYRQEVYACVRGLIAQLPWEEKITHESPWWAILMGIEHERIHIETSSVLHRQMPLEYVRSDDRFSLCPDQHTPTPSNTLVRIEGMRIVLGKGDEDGAYYGWDNEYGHEEIDVASFEASRYLVSHAEYLPFVEAGGYHDPQWWDEEGWRYLQSRGLSHPPFWVVREGGYGYRTLTQEIDLPLSWPVEVNALEAIAFCRWKSAHEGRIYRLPSEAQWEVMARRGGVKTIFEQANCHLEHYASSVPIDRFAHGELYDVIGNVWQWSATSIYPFEGFAPHPWYDDFSTPTFDGLHALMKGGSWISTGNETLRSARYAFRRHFIQHAGFRYVCGGDVERARDASVYVGSMARSCAQEFGSAAMRVAQVQGVIGVEDRVLIMGCGVGALALELSRLIGCEVVALERSAYTFTPAVALIEQGVCRYEIDGVIHTHTYEGPRVQFYQADLTNLKPHIGRFDWVLFEREPTPQEWEMARTRVGHEDAVVVVCVS